MRERLAVDPAIAAELAGECYFLDHPYADHAAAAQTARNKYNSCLLQECFVAGWNRMFWKD